MELSKSNNEIGHFNSYGAAQRVHEGIDADQSSATSIGHQTDQTLRDFCQFHSS